MASILPALSIPSEKPNSGSEPHTALRQPVEIGRLNGQVLIQNGVDPETAAEYSAAPWTFAPNARGPGSAPAPMVAAMNSLWVLIVSQCITGGSIVSCR